MCAGFRVDGDDVGARVGKRLNIFLRLDDHEMNVDDFFRRGTDGLHHERANRDVRHETAVHDVYVDPIGASSINRLDFSLKAAKISGKNRRGDSEGLWGSGHGSSQALRGQHVNGIRSLTAIVAANDNGMTP
jgi:hypothetical protein